MRNYNFKHFLAVLLIGVVSGILLHSSYNHLRTLEEIDHGNDLVDYVISQWTGVPIDEPLRDSLPLDQAQLSARAELPMSRLGYFPDTVRTLAAIVEARYKVPAAVTMAQWALESGWGKRNLNVSNYFGHTFAATKRFCAAPKFVTCRELVSVRGANRPGNPVRFTSYTSIKECFDVHGQYLSSSQLYRAAFVVSDAEQFARIIALHYATDPDYAVKLITIIRRYKL
jgi:hypothetical protein